MKIPKVIYENLPYGYFLISFVTIVKAQSALFYISAALFYFAGAMTWALRSNARRLDTPNKHATYIFNVRLSNSLYELKPFIQFALGIIAILSFKNDIVTFFAVCLCLYSFQNLTLRILNRRKRDIELSYGKRITKRK